MLLGFGGCANDGAPSAEQTAPSPPSAQLVLRVALDLSIAGEAGDFIEPRFSADGTEVILRRAGTSEETRSALPVQVVVPPVVVPTRVIRYEGNRIISTAVDGTDKRILFQGDSFFEPLMSPDGARVLVHESRGREGHLWVIGVTGDSPVDLGVGYAATWMADSKRLVFEILSFDDDRVAASDLWVVEVATGERVLLTTSETVAEVEPHASIDGKYIIARDALSPRLLLFEITE